MCRSKLARAAIVSVAALIFSAYTPQAAGETRLATESASPCKLSSGQLLRIAREDQVQFCGADGSRCEFLVNEKRCTVQIWPLVEVQVPGGFEVLVISNDGKVLKRIGGA